MKRKSLLLALAALLVTLTAFAGEKTIAKLHVAQHSPSATSVHNGTNVYRGTSDDLPDFWQ